MPPKTQVHHRTTELSPRVPAERKGQEVDPRVHANRVWHYRFVVLEDSVLKEAIKLKM